MHVVTTYRLDCKSPSCCFFKALEQVRAQQQTGPLPQQNGQQPTQPTAVQTAQAPTPTPAVTQAQVVVQQQPAAKNPNTGTTPITTPALIVSHADFQKTITQTFLHLC